MSFKQVLFFSLLFFWLPATCQPVAAEVLWLTSSCMLLLRAALNVLAWDMWEAGDSAGAWGVPFPQPFLLEVIFSPVTMSSCWFPFSSPLWMNVGSISLANQSNFHPKEWKLERAPAATGLWRYNSFGNSAWIFSVCYWQTHLRWKLRLKYLFFFFFLSYNSAFQMPKAFCKIGTRSYGHFGKSNQIYDVLSRRASTEINSSLEDVSLEQPPRCRFCYVLGQ